MHSLNKQVLCYALKALSLVINNGNRVVRLPFVVNNEPVGNGQGVGVVCFLEDLAQLGRIGAEFL